MLKTNLSLLGQLSLSLCFAVLLSACSAEQSTDTVDAPEATQDISEAGKTSNAASSGATLSEILAAQPEDVQARYQYRNPEETITFFGIEPGMAVVEALPGGGWYSKILLQYLGPEGQLIGADYSLDMYPKFGFFSEERLEAKKTWATDWTAEASGWAGDTGAKASAFAFGSMPESLYETADAVIFIRALHNLARFDDDGDFLTTALSNAYDALKPGGIVGVVQHEARADMPANWADGSNGYLKRSDLIERFEASGFEYIESSDINQNPDDQPTDSDIVWRLPPSFSTSRENPELKETMAAIGESNRMTLKFIKPL